MDTAQQAAIAEHRVIARALEFGYTVSVPTTPARYDLVFEKEGRFLRVQVKYGGHVPTVLPALVESALTAGAALGTLAGSVPARTRWAKLT